MMIEDAATDFGLTRAPAAVLCRLAVSPGRVVAAQELRDAMEAASGGRATHEALVSAIRRVRVGLAGRGTVKAANGIGYRLEWVSPLSSDAGRG